MTAALGTALHPHPSSLGGTQFSRYQNWFKDYKENKTTTAIRHLTPTIAKSNQIDECCPLRKETLHMRVLLFTGWGLGGGGACAH